MDFLNNFQKKYIPNIHKFRYDQRKARVNALKQVCLKTPQKLSSQQIRVIMRVLKHYNLLPISEEYVAKQKMFMFKAGENFLYSSVLSFSPLLLREFYSKGFVNKFAVIAGIFVGSYGLLMRKPFMEIQQYNRKMAQENIHKFSIDLEEKQEEQTQKKQQGKDSKK